MCYRETFTPRLTTPDYIVWTTALIGCLPGVGCLAGVAGLDTIRVTELDALNVGPTLDACVCGRPSAAVTVLGGGDPRGVTNWRGMGLCTVADDAVLEASIDRTGPAVLLDRTGLVVLFEPIVLPCIEGDLADEDPAAEVSANSTGPVPLGAEGDLTSSTEGDLTEVSTTRAGPPNLCTEEDLLWACDGNGIDAKIEGATFDVVALPVTCSTAFATASIIDSAPSVSSVQVAGRCGCATDVAWTTCVTVCGCGGDVAWTACTTVCGCGRFGCTCMTRGGDGCRCSCSGEVARRGCSDVNGKGFDVAKNGFFGTVHDCCSHGSGGVAVTSAFAEGKSGENVVADDCASVLSQER